MKLNSRKSLFLSGLFLFFSLSLNCMDPESSKERKIGAEIETSAIKVKLKENYYSGFRVSLNEIPLWSVEQDTTDNVFSKSENPGEREFQYNLEFKTHGGYDSQESFLKVLTTITSVLKLIHTKSDDGYTLTIEELGKLLGEESGHYSIEKLDKEQGEFVLKKNPKHMLVRPQITYQLPLEEVIIVFQRLKHLKDRTTMRFLKALDGKKHEYPETASPEINVSHVFKTLKFLNDNFYLILSHPKTEATDRVRGFSCLFLFYWYNIFNNCMPIENTEPGLKPFLPIMSRISFSQMYDEGLVEDEKEQFKKLFREIVESSGDQYKVRGYTDYEGKIVKSNLTLKDWYDSIVEKNNRRKVLKESSNSEPVDYLVDLLSPPEGLPEHYAMGLFPWELIQSPLIEVRSYAIMTFNSEKITVDNVNSFLEAESNWFFNAR